MFLYEIDKGRNVFFLAEYGSGKGFISSALAAVDAGIIFYQLAAVNFDLALEHKKTVADGFCTRKSILGISSLISLRYGRNIVCRQQIVTAYNRLI